MLNTIDQIFIKAKQIILDILSPFLPEWMMILISIFIVIVTLCVFGPVVMMYLTLLERKFIGRMQNRYGPNRCGIFGLLQPLSDGIKMFTKEDIVPQKADPFAHFLGPITVIIPSLLVFSVIPFGRNMIPSDLSIGILFFFAVASTSTLWIFTAAWGSRNKFSLLGGMRAVAQMVSYEIPMLLSIVPALLVVGSFSTVAIVNAQEGLQWFVFTPWGLVGFILFFLTGVAEVNRCPFDLPEGESEIIAGFHTEYSGMKFALFYMAEYMNAFSVSALVTTVYLGGWQGPILPSWLWFFAKTFVLISIMMWFRGTFPRMRVDQLMGFAWRGLLPLAFINLLAAALWVHLSFPLNDILSFCILTVSVLMIYVANRKVAPKKRIYKYAYE
ncbi:MAG: hypothetical protein A3G33_09640 [Omnitrophica bacterium RIFCSPLOWO2_12_FULL_44_17]|uniref:NADH-quinone oxidoreductase subunit H n=1 Tax=Candidatus Danuiimicrobium aquiferis TaxID=1801832 RepID=A0A1G1KX31_9BACT|nr:MAG: hypothetical protein A3B72_09720 [Omnitrophica bacterium RIFCSPHIGHO2_02_FULL_45_28]OGW89635.1 MAG: hypothetical protein A3E74_05085 [Omnitrophica bacterium RIFCSPHIGHO2_12_FULL_44_12]OGW97441.1 MAG: hypothetical protein A3G33_09640 [Omnitrophica bacterium RIFCSPLOWO2_12_FULL_44_17]OGX04514.1 MAG: hypothetical protein A3J12_10680 [Omnitrophica bacterium RIFCSPLOWO2_02_FULL_44_11]